MPHTMVCSDPQDLVLPQLSCSGRSGFLGVYYSMSSLVFLRIPVYSEFSLDATCSCLFLAGIQDHRGEPERPCPHDHRLYHAEEVGRPLSAPRQPVWVLVPAEETLTPSDPQLLQDLHRDKNLETAYTLTQRFHQMMHGRTAAALALWLVDCHASGRSELVNCARGIQREPPAVQAALEPPYSHGQVEGQITKSKLRKRQSDGPAKLGRLRQRLPHAA